MGTGEWDVDIDWEGHPLTEEAAETQTHEESCPSPSRVCTGPGAYLRRPGMRWGSGRRGAEADAVLEATKAFTSIVSFHHLTLCAAHGPLLQTLPRSTTR